MQNPKAPVGRPKKNTSTRFRRLIRAELNRSIETKTQLQITDSQQVGLFTGENKLIVLCNDVFKTVPGVLDGTQSATNQNRIGDQISALGFVLRYRLTNKCLYTNNGGLNVTIPFVTYRIIVIQANAPNAQLGNPTKTDILDYTHPIYNILPCECPLNKNGGYIKKVLLDKRITINNHGLMVNNNTQNSTALAGTSKDFKKYIKFPFKINYCDTTDAQGSPVNDSMYPIYVLLMSDMGQNMSAPDPVTASIGWCTGYTQAWFKDA